MGAPGQAEKDALLAAYREAEERADAGGGVLKQQRQNKLGRLTARQRLAALMDDGVVDELDRHVVHRGRGNERTPGDGVITAVGRVGGRPVAAFAHDVTVRRGAMGVDGARKVVRLLELAQRARMPVVGIHDSDGVRVDEGPEAIHGYGEIIAATVEGSGLTPQLSVVCGLCVGAAAYTAALTDTVIMVEPWAFMFITGSKVTRTVTGEDTPVEELGGAAMHHKLSGAAQLLAADDAGALALARRVLAYLPQGYGAPLPLTTPADKPARPTPELWDLIPHSRRKIYDVGPVVRALMDEGSVLPWSDGYANNLMCALARLDGVPVGVVASNPRHRAGSLDIESSRKGARFVQLCSAFGLPIITLADVPGYVPGKAQEQGGILLHGARLLHAYGAAAVPRISVVLGKSYGGASVLAYTGDVVLALPHARYDVVGPEAAANILDHGEDLTPEERAARKAAFLAARDRAHASAEAGLVDRVVLPENLRAELVRTVHALRELGRHNTPHRRYNPPT